MKIKEATAWAILNPRTGQLVGRTPLLYGSRRRARIEALGSERPVRVRIVPVSHGMVKR